MKKKNILKSLVNISGLSLITMILITLTLFINPLSKVIAAETGTAYTATAKAYYKHPVTGEIEDPGNNEGIGQSMTESVLHSTALIEKTDSGKIYATVRFFLTDNISKVQFSTQKRGATTWKSVSSTTMQENMGGVYCSDYRFEIPSDNAVVRSSIYVSAMGRSVIFYFDFSNLKEGSSDFITTVTKSTSKEDTTQSKDTSNENKENKETTSTTINQSNSESNTTTTSNSKSDEVRNSSNTVDSQAISSSKDSETVETNEKENSSDNQQSEDSEETKVSEEEKVLLDSSEDNSSESEFQQLINNATGLVLSDESLLDTEENVEEVESAENVLEETNRIPSLSWTLVWQCILIITLPGLIVGGTLLGVKSYLNNKVE